MSTENRQSSDVFNPHCPEHYNSPDAYLHRARTQCPVSRASDVLYVLSRDEDVRAVFADHKNFSNRGNFSIHEHDLDIPVPLITMSDPPVHTELRRRLSRNFAPVRLRQLTPEIADVVANAIDGLADESGVIDLYDRYIQYLPTRVLYALIGIPKPRWHDVQNWTDIVNEALPFPEKAPEYALLTNYLAELIDQRRANPEMRTPDVLDNLCFADEGERDMTTTEVVMHVWQLLGAGTDTTRALIASCVFRLLSNRERWDRIVADRSRLNNAIEESLRFDTPAAFMVRSVDADVEIAGCPIAAGNKVYLSLLSANHDEKVWGENSQEFDPDRRGAAAHIAFGRGIHTCIGAPLVRIEASLAIGALMDSFPNLRLASDATWTKVDSPLFRRPQEVRVTL